MLECGSCFLCWLNSSQTTQQAIRPKTSWFWWARMWMERGMLCEGGKLFYLCMYSGVQHTYTISQYTSTLIRVSAFLPSLVILALNIWVERVLCCLFSKLCIWDEVAFLSLRELSTLGLRWSSWVSKSSLRCPLRNLTGVYPWFDAEREKKKKKKCPLTIWLLTLSLTFWIFKLCDYFQGYATI